MSNYEDPIIKIFKTLAAIYTDRYVKEPGQYSADFLNGFSNCYTLFDIGYEKSLFYKLVKELEKTQAQMKYFAGKDDEWKNKIRNRMSQLYDRHLKQFYLQVEQ